MQNTTSAIAQPTTVKIGKAKIGTSQVAIIQHLFTSLQHIVEMMGKSPKTFDYWHGQHIAVVTLIRNLGVNFSEIEKWECRTFGKPINQIFFQ